MKCRECLEGKKITERKVMCIPYGMIISAEHECTREGGRQHDRSADHSQGGEDGTKVQTDGGGTA